MRWRSRTTQLSLVFLQIRAVLGLYEPIREYSGQDFFSEWDFTSGVDSTTSGNVQYLDQSAATQQRLAFVDSSSGHAIVRVDNTTKLEDGPSVHRNSVKIISKDAYPIGSLIIIDAVHIPYGCSVWPAFWTLGTELGWPHAGEIDIIEGINGMTSNSMVMHTDAGCTQSSNVSQSGKTLDTDCGTAVGCKVEDTKPNSYGPGFVQAGGGVFAAQIDASGVFLWFWSRRDIPASISESKPGGAIDMSDWGQPSAAYPNDACDIAKFFKPQKLVLDITLCGQWAGIPSIYSATCPGECIANVIGDGSNYGTAYWEISYIRTFATKKSNVHEALMLSKPSSNPPISTHTTLGSITGASKGVGSPFLPILRIRPWVAATVHLFDPSTPSTAPTLITTSSDVSRSTVATSHTSLDSFNPGGIDATSDNLIVLTTTSTTSPSSLGSFNLGGINATGDDPVTSTTATTSSSSLGSFNLGGINATGDDPVVPTTTVSPSSLGSFNLGGINGTSSSLCSFNQGGINATSSLPVVPPTGRDTSTTSPRKTFNPVESTEPTSSSSALELSLNTTLFFMTIPSFLAIILAIW